MNILNIFSWINLPVPAISLPIGISFFTFQALSYVIDIYRGKVSAQKNMLFVGLYISFFPQLIAGPIVRYETVRNQILNRKETPNDVFDGFAYGAKKALGVAFVVILVYTCLVLVTYHPFQLTVYKALLGIGKGFNLVTTMISFILASIFNGDVSYVAQSVVPYYTSVVTNVNRYPLVAIIFQSMYGFTALFAPTSLILMGTLSYLGISYKDWLKNIWKLLLELFVILLIVFIILAVA